MTTPASASSSAPRGLGTFARSSHLERIRKSLLLVSQEPEHPREDAAEEEAERSRRRAARMQAKADQAMEDMNRLIEDSVGPVAPPLAVEGTAPR